MVYYLTSRRVRSRKFRFGGLPVFSNEDAIYSLILGYKMFVFECTHMHIYIFYKRLSITAFDTSRRYASPRHQCVLCVTECPCHVEELSSNQKIKFLVKHTYFFRWNEAHLYNWVYMEEIQI